MATVYGVNKTKMLTPSASNILDQGATGGKVVAMIDSYEAAALAAASVIQMCDKIPAGASVLRITLLTDDLGGTATVDIGDVADDDRYASAFDISGAAKTYVFPETAAGANIDAFPYQVGAATGDDQIALTINTSAVTGTIDIIVEYCI